MITVIYNTTPKVFTEGEVSTILPCDVNGNLKVSGLSPEGTPKFAAISASASGDNTLIAAVPGKKIRVLAYTIVCTTAVTVKFKSGIGGADLTGAMPFGVNGGAAPTCPFGHFETASGALLNLVLGSAVVVAGHITYIEV